MQRKKKLEALVFLLGIMFAVFLSTADIQAADTNAVMLAIDGSVTATYTYDMTELFGLVYIPVRVSQPGESRLDIDIANAKQSIVVGTSKGMEWEIESDRMFTAVTQSTHWERTFETDTTYYLYALTSQIMPDEDHVIITVKHTFTPATGNAALEAGKWHDAVQAADTLDYSLTLSKKGCINMEADAGLAVISLLDSNKKVLLKDWTSKDDCALNPGAYYIRVTNDSKKSAVGKYRIRYNYIKTPSAGASGGKKLSSAKTLKLGRKVTLFNPYISNKGKETKTYYKVDVPKKKKLYVTYQAYAYQGSVHYRLYKKDQKTGKYTYIGGVFQFDDSGKKKTECLSATMDLDTLKSKEFILSKGTYYVEVENSMNGGMCTFAVK